MKKPNKIYVVSCHSGSYDSEVSWIDSMFYDAEDAEKEKDRLNTYAKHVQSECPDYKEDGTKEEDYRYWKYYAENENEMEWHDAVVAEREII